MKDKIKQANKIRINKKINKNTTLKDILNKKGTEEILEKFNLPCIHCPMANQEIAFLKIGDVCMVYGIDAKKLLEELNKLK
jgi:hybrid cluster-associated redox disulfide protein